MAMSASHAEPDDDARHGDATATLLPVGPLDLCAGDKAEDDAQDGREEEDPGARADERRDGQPVGLLATGWP